MTDESKPQPIIWWVLWGAFLSGVVIIYFLIGSGAEAQRPPAESPIWLAGLGPVLVATLIRWVVLPRASSAQAALPFFVVGLALAEATCFLGLFVFPEHKRELFALSVLGIFQFVPYFAGTQPSSPE